MQYKHHWLLQESADTLVGFLFCLDKSSDESDDEEAEYNHEANGDYVSV